MDSLVQMDSLVSSTLTTDVSTPFNRPPQASYTTPLDPCRLFVGYINLSCQRQELETIMAQVRKGIVWNLHRGSFDVKLCGRRDLWITSRCSPTIVTTNSSGVPLCDISTHLLHNSPSVSSTVYAKGVDLS